MENRKRYLIFALIVIVILLLFSVLKYSEYKNSKEIKRYEEIISDFEKAVEWNLDATNLSEKNCEENVSKSVRLTSEYLNSQGYLKMEVMKDVSGDSYCKAYAETFKTEDCGVDYKIYLSCKNYETEGYVNWGS